MYQKKAIAWNLDNTVGQLFKIVALPQYERQNDVVKNTQTLQCTAMGLVITFMCTHDYMIMDMGSLVSKSSDGKWSNNGFIAGVQRLEEFLTCNSTE